MGQPTAANIAMRPCFISASRIANNSFSDFATPKNIPCYNSFIKQDIVVGYREDRIPSLRRVIRQVEEEHLHHRYSTLVK